MRHATGRFTAHRGLHHPSTQCGQPAEQRIARNGTAGPPQQSPYAICTHDHAGGDRGGDRPRPDPAAEGLLGRHRYRLRLGRRAAARKSASPCRRTGPGVAVEAGLALPRDAGRRSSQADPDRLRALLDRPAGVAESLDALELLCKRIFSVKSSTRVKTRPEQGKALKLPYDSKEAARGQEVILTVHGLKRLAHNAAQPMTLSDQLRTAGVQLALLTGPLTASTTPTAWARCSSPCSPPQPRATPAGGHRSSTATCCCTPARSRTRAFPSPMALLVLDGHVQRREENERRGSSARLPTPARRPAPRCPRAGRRAAGRGVRPDPRARGRTGTGCVAGLRAHRLVLLDAALSARAPGHSSCTGNQCDALAPEGAATQRSSGVHSGKPVGLSLLALSHVPQDGRRPRRLRPGRR